MPDDTRQPDEIEAQVGDKKLRIRGSDVLGLLNMLFIGIVLYGGYDHIGAAKEGEKSIAEAIKESNQMNVKLVRAMQESNCLNRLTPEQKKKFEEIKFCKDIGEGR